MDIRYEEPLYVDELSLQTVRVLGQGAFGSVTLKAHPGYGLYAKKTSSIRLKENLKKELRIMLNFRNHPRIVQASSEHLHLGMFLKDCYIYMEYASLGSLNEVISSFRGKPLPEHVIGRTTRMLLQGLEALHLEGYVHCDLKPDNILLFPSTSFGEPWDAKLADFGLSKEPNTYSVLKSAGTNMYMPPEVAEDPEGLIGQALDIWSLGCVVFEMFGGKAMEMATGVTYVWQLEQEISPVAIDFLRQCHAWHPWNRASATELLNHPFIIQRVSGRILQPIPSPPEKRQYLERPLFASRVRGPLPTPIGPRRRQKEAQGSVVEDQSAVEKNDEASEEWFMYELCNSC
ncbi:unnamed protein product [Eruca vesicaria subsp. sativa]|uniref:Protein kinase domain-containing protein n=1 Tax=Eruca vesicaria subsp. sativa TaxID=29727 RepID=A0ABC8L8F7_ERUVS|nr:unnamed protein product [Eruca vesicaria subsp. sativa]